MQDPDARQDSLFVDDESLDKGKRTRVMKRHVREQRSQRLRATGLTANVSFPTRALPWAIGAADSVLKPDVTTADFIQSQTGEALEARGDICQEDTESTVELSSQDPCGYAADNILEQHLIAPGCADPFETLPVPVTAECQHLMDIWISKLACYSGQNKFMKLAIFREAMLHPMTFHVTVLSYTARYHRKVMGVKETAGTAMYTSTAERKLGEYMIKTPNPEDDKIAMAFAALALQEERFGAPEKAWHYMDRAMEHGKFLMGRRPVHETFLHYVRNTLSPRDPLEDPNEALQLVNFLRRADGVASRWALPSQVPNWATAFDVGTPLHFLLSSGPHPSCVPYEERVWVVENGELHFTCRTASLSSVAISLLTYTENAAICAWYLESMLAVLHERELDRKPSSESLLWMLLEEPYPRELRSPSRAWFVGDLMSIVSKLPYELRFQFGELLLRFLMLWKPDLEISIGSFETQLWEYMGLSAKSPVSMMTW